MEEGGIMLYHGARSDMVCHSRCGRCRCGVKK